MGFHTSDPSSFFSIHLEGDAKDQSAKLTPEQIKAWTPPKSECSLLGVFSFLVVHFLPCPLTCLTFSISGLFHSLHC